MGIILDFVYEKTETIWMPTLMHAAINSFIVVFFLAKPEYSDKAILGPTSVGVIGMIPLVVLAVIISAKRKRGEDKKDDLSLNSLA